LHNRPVQRFMTGVKSTVECFSDLPKCSSDKEVVIATTYPLFMCQSRKGLGRQLAAAVAEEPARYSLVATNFNGLDPTYVRSLITGFKDALTKQQSFEWSPVLAFCRTVVESPWQIEPGDSHLARLNTYSTVRGQK
jgi:hypothetical protein